MCVLSLATLSFDVRNDIPSVPYATALDWFLYMCYLFLFASLLEFTAVHYFTKVKLTQNHLIINTFLIKNLSYKRSDMEIIKEPQLMMKMKMKTVK